MTKEERELLLKDLCARLPYRPFVSTYSRQFNDGSLELLTPELLKIFVIDEFFEIKPYLRSMSSMTEEEKEEYDDLLMSVNDGCENTDYLPYSCMKYVDWLNSHGFDYRGLIPKGLALEDREDK
jgi:hypothetical protein